jgi:hypothetical protein
MALAAVAVAAWSPPALAAGPDNAAVESAETASRGAEAAVGPAESDDVAFGEAPSSAGAIVADAGGASVASPIEAEDPIVLESGDEAFDIGITLPASASVGDAEVVDGDTVYVDERAETSFVVDARADGARIMSVLTSPRAPREFTYDLHLPEGTQLLERADGSVDVAVVWEGVEVIVGTVAAPWAVDAQGNSVPTHYEVAGDTLTQHVSVTSGTQFPVIADPTYSWKWWGVVVRFNRSETVTMQTASGVCAIAAAIPEPLVSKIIAGSCAVIAVAAQDALQRGKCLRLNVHYPPVSAAYPWSGTC